jgi:EAL domain-containing protein (putative c-di-GMP-specific phosphodiesterase class I)
MPTTKPARDRNTRKGSQPVPASSGSVAASGTVVEATPDGGTNAVVVGPGCVVVVRGGRVVVGPAGAVVVVVSAVVVVVSAGSVVVERGTSVVLVVVVRPRSVVVVVDDGMICASAPEGDVASAIATRSTPPSARRVDRRNRRTCSSSPLSKVEVDSFRRTVVESLHLTGPLPAVRRLVLIADELGIDHEVVAGVLRLPVESAPPLFDRAAHALAPLEAALVRVVRTDLVSGEPSALLAATAAAPTLAHIIARRRHRKLLEAITSRAGVAVGYQPVVDLSAARTIGFEALLRVRIGTLDVSPADVLAAAEEAGRLAEIDSVARSAAVAGAAPAIGDRLLFLNVLPASLPVPPEHLAPFRREVLERGLDPAHIVLEAPLGPAGALRRQLESVFEAARAAGFLVGLDNVRSDRDLGAIVFRPDTVKLDRSLVRGLPSSSAARTFSHVVRETSHASSTLIAQGIESEEHVRAVRDLGVAYAQGWHLGRPGAITAEVVDTAVVDTEVVVDAS